FAVRLLDGNVVETVLIYHPQRWTVCVSSQVGCARGCVFCETGRLGLVRNLTAAEIVSQYAIAARHLGERPKNVVFMGMGELREAIAKVPRTVLLQWTLIEGVNDADSDADELAEFARDLDVRVNLIPLNPGPVKTQRAPSMERCRAFQKRLADRGVRTLLRMPHGQRIGGACGQLAGSRRFAAAQADNPRRGV